MIRDLAAAALRRAARVAGKAAEKVLEDPRGQEALARAVGLAQRGKQAADELQERALHAAGIAARRDHEELRRQIARIRRKARELDQKLRVDDGGEGPGSR